MQSIHPPNLSTTIVTIDILPSIYSIQVNILKGPIPNFNTNWIPPYIFYTLYI